MQIFHVLYNDYAWGTDVGEPVQIMPYLPLWSCHRCSKGEAQCASAGWHQEGHPVRKTSHKNPLLNCQEATS